MKCLTLSLALLSTVICTQVSQAIEYEPLLVFTLKEEMTTTDGQTQTKTEVVRTVAQLPWVPLSERDWAMPPQGFTASSEPTSVRWHEKELKGEKIVWRHQGKLASHYVEEVRIVRSDLIPTPSFLIPLSNQSDLPVPSGCVKIDVVPLKPDSPGASDFDVRNTFSLSGTYGEAKGYRLGDKEFKAHSFTYTMGAKEQNTKATFLLSSEIPGNICRVVIDRKGGRRSGKGSISITAITEAPLPAKLDTFEKKGFAFAPPDGFEKAEEPGENEIVRYTNARGHNISISSIDLGSEGLPGYWSVLSNRAREKENLAICQSRNDHIAGNESLTVCDSDTNDGYIVTLRNGKGYKIFITGLYATRPADVISILSGWRWIKK